MYQRWMALRLAVLSYLVWIAGAQTTCPPISGKPSCVCQHPDGVIDLTPLANPTSNGKPRYKYMSNPTHTLLRMYSKVLYVCVLESLLVQRSQTRKAYARASGLASKLSVVRDLQTINTRLSLSMVELWCGKRRRIQDGHWELES